MGGGAIVDAYQTGRALYKGDYAEAAKNAGELGLGLLGIKSAVQTTKAVKTAKVAKNAAEESLKVFKANRKKGIKVTGKQMNDAKNAVKTTRKALTKANRKVRKAKEMDVYTNTAIVGSKGVSYVYDVNKK